MVQNRDGVYKEKKKLKNLWPIRTSDLPHRGRHEFMTQIAILHIMKNLITNRHEMIYYRHENDDGSHGIFHDGGYNFMACQKSTFQMCVCVFVCLLRE